MVSSFTSASGGVADGCSLSTFREQAEGKHTARLAVHSRQDCSASEKSSHRSNCVRCVIRNTSQRSENREGRKRCVRCAATLLRTQKLSREEAEMAVYK